MNTKVLTLTLVGLLLVAFGMTGLATAIDKDNDGLEDGWESEHGYDNTTKDNPLDDKNSDQVVDRNVYEYRTNYLYTFIYVTIISFGLFSLVLGAFTAKYAQGRSRITGAILLALGAIIGALFFLFSVLGIRKYPDDTLIPVYGLIHWQAQWVIMPFFTVLAAGIGALLALIFFLVIIMKA